MADRSADRSKDPVRTEGRGAAGSSSERSEATAPGGVIEASEEEARRELRGGARPLLIDFHATWCGPCRWLEPVLEDLSGEFGERVTFLKVDVDQAEALAAEYRIASVPTVVLVRDGEEVGRSLGLEPDRLRAMLEDLPVAADMRGGEAGGGSPAGEG